jgi:hypothetical protein
MYCLTRFEKELKIIHDLLQSKQAKYTFWHTVFFLFHSSLPDFFAAPPNDILPLYFIVSYATRRCKRVSLLCS